MKPIDWILSILAAVLIFVATSAAFSTCSKMKNMNKTEHISIKKTDTLIYYVLRTGDSIFTYKRTKYGDSIIKKEAYNKDQKRSGK